MQNFVAVYVVQSVQQLLQNFLYFTQTEFDVHIGQQSSQIVFTEIEYQVERRSVAVVFVCLRATDFQKIDDVLMLQQLENANFT
jgi:hypothetical protein